MTPHSLPDDPTPMADSPSPAAAPNGFPVVGIGASAGGLEALEKFFGQVPVDCGLAWVVIQNQDPTHSSLLPELLQRYTPLPVKLASDQLLVQRDHVYVIPPKWDLSILHGVLRLHEPTAPRGLRLSIDFFLRALAEDRGPASVGVLLSGMGSDGTQGLRDIQHHGGLTLVQTPATAKFAGMLSSAVLAGVADIVAPAATARYPQSGRAGAGTERASQPDPGHDFSQYKPNTLYRRIERRMGIHRIDRVADYARFLRGNPQETQLLFRELLVGVTRFFRDPAAWESLKTPGAPGALRLLGRTHAPPRLDRRLLQRRRSLFPGHRLPGSARGAGATPFTRPANLCDRPG